MIINTNRTEEQQLTISYIRHLAHTLKSQPNLQSSDSLALSRSSSDVLKKNNVSKKKKKKREESAQSYVSPYKQKDLSMKKIMNTRRSSPFPHISYSQIIAHEAPQKPKVSKSPAKIVSPARYRLCPSLFQKYEKSQVVDQMKIDARDVYLKRQAEKIQLTNRQKSQRWADFLLRERRWQSGKQDKRRQAEQFAIAKEKQEQKNQFTARQYPRMNIDEHIRMVNRKKTKLKQQLKSQLLNYYTWEKPTHSPVKNKSRQAFSSRPKQKSPISVKSRLTSREKVIQLRTNQQVKFLINKNR